MSTYYTCAFWASSPLTTSIHRSRYCTVHIYVVIRFYDSMSSFLVEANMCRFFLSFVYLCIAAGDPVIKKGIPLTGLIPPNVCSCSKLGPGFPTSYVVVFLCSATSVKIRDDCSFCWYWWNWWSSLFKFSFHNDVIIYLSGSVGSFLTNLCKYPGGFLS